VTRAQERGLGHRHSQRLFAAGDVLFLALYNGRKKAAVPSAGQFRRLFSAYLRRNRERGLFALHVGIPWPTGVLNSHSMVYLTTVTSGS